MASSGNFAACRWHGGFEGKRIVLMKNAELNLRQSLSP
jgi:hypothetical protein